MPKSVRAVIRLGLAGVVALYALMQIPVALMILGFKSGRLDLAADMDGVTAGDSYQRFVPLMEQMSSLQLGAAFVQIVLYLAAAAALALGWRRAPLLFAAALAVQAVSLVSMRALPAYSQTWSQAESAQDVVILAVMALIAAAAFWLTPRRPGPAAA